MLVFAPCESLFRAALAMHMHQLSSGAGLMLLSVPWGSTLSTLLTLPCDK